MSRRFKNIMAPFQLSCHQISLLLAEKVTPEFNLEQDLLCIANFDHPYAREQLCLIFRTQLGLSPDEVDGTFFHECWSWKDDFDERHAPFAAALVSWNFVIAYLFAF